MKKSIIISLMFCICTLAIHLQILYSQVIYVDSNTGNDHNRGTEEAPMYSIYKAAEMIRSQDNDITTIKINPGIYALESPVSVSTEKDMTDKHIVIEATILPDDSLWTPEKMPVIISTSKKGDVPDLSYHFVIGFLINESHVTIKGIKFPGYFYPNTRYFPIARFNKEKTDLLVEQCVFVGDDNVSHLQVGIIAHGDSIRADHCIFYHARNGVVFWQDAGTGIKTGNGITNSIMIGASQSALWTAWPDNDFIFKNNIVSNCKHFWLKNFFVETEYSIENSIIVNNQYYQGVWHEGGVVPEEFIMNENNIIKEGKISLTQKAENVDLPLPIDYLHIMPDSPGYDIGAGLFKHRKP